MSPHREGIPRNHRYQPRYNSFDEVTIVSSTIKKSSVRRNGVGPHRHGQGFAVDAGNIKESPKSSSPSLIIHLKEERQKDWPQRLLRHLSSVLVANSCLNGLFQRVNGSMLILGFFFPSLSGISLNYLFIVLANGDIILWCASSVAQSCPTLCDPMDCSLQGSSVHEIFQTRILEWVVISFSRRSSLPRDQTRGSSLASGFFTTAPLWQE